MHLKRHYIRGHAESQWQIATEFWLFRAPPFPSQFSLLHFSTTTQKVCLRSLQIYLCSHHFSSINFGMLLWFVIWIVISVLLGFFFLPVFWSMILVMEHWSVSFVSCLWCVFWYMLACAISRHLNDLAFDSGGALFSFPILFGSTNSFRWFWFWFGWSADLV